MSENETSGTAAALLEATLLELAESGSAEISLRAVARRAGVSHAAPKYFFGDRAGLLAAAAAVGFGDLARQVRSAAADRCAPLVLAGEAYVDFALSRPALFDLMFRPAELDDTDGRLRAAGSDALMALNEIVDPVAARRGTVSNTTLVAWALAHGVANLARTGALDRSTTDGVTGAQAAHQLIATFAAQFSPPRKE